MREAEKEKKKEKERKRKRKRKRKRVRISHHLTRGEQAYLRETQTEKNGGKKGKNETEKNEETKNI